MKSEEQGQKEGMKERTQEREKNVGGNEGEKITELRKWEDKNFRKRK